MVGPVMIGLVKIGPVMIVMIGPAIVVGRVLLTKQCENLVRCCQTMIALVVWVVAERTLELMVAYHNFHELSTKAF